MNEVLPPAAEKHFQGIPEAAKWPLAILAGSAPIVYKLIVKKPPMNPAITFPLAILSAVLGYNLPGQINRHIATHGSSPEELENLRRSIGKEHTETFVEFGKGIISSHMAPAEEQEKVAAIPMPSLGSLPIKGLRGALNVGYDITRGIGMPIIGRTAGETALSLASKGLLFSGMYQGGKFIGRQSRYPGYTTMLRNQILAGRLNPAELTQEDWEAVKSLGF